MAADILLALIGIAIAAVTLRDVFDTVIVPGTSHTSLHVARRLVLLLLPIWKRIRGRRRALSGNFAPITPAEKPKIFSSYLSTPLTSIGSRRSPPPIGFGRPAWI